MRVDKKVACSSDASPEFTLWQNFYFFEHGSEESIKKRFKITRVRQEIVFKHFKCIRIQTLSSFSTLRASCLYRILRRVVFNITDKLLRINSLSLKCALDFILPKCKMW